MDKSVQDKKLTNAISWFIPFAILLFCFYRFALKPSVWWLIISCIMCFVLGWMLNSYFGGSL